MHAQSLRAFSRRAVGVLSFLSWLCIPVLAGGVDALVHPCARLVNSCVSASDSFAVVCTLSSHITQYVGKASCIPCAPIPAPIVRPHFI